MRALQTFGAGRKRSALFLRLSPKEASWDRKQRAALR